MIDRHPPEARRWLRWTALTTLSMLLASAPSASNLKTTFRFGVTMARDGNWREAHYRWERVAHARPDDPKVRNNLAVALEALERPEEAREEYLRAARLSSGDSRIESNLSQFERFWAWALEDEADGEEEPAPQASDRNGKGKTIKVGVALPVPPRMDLAGDRTLLVASFLSDENVLIDSDREIVRFVRSTLRKAGTIEVLDVTPAPAIPEQSVEDLLANAEFWKHLGREYGADLIASGVIRFDRTDHSGYRNVDVISPTTGQKVRRTAFVEQEKFVYDVDLFVMDGDSGALRHRDRLRRSMIFEGSQNDPITAFFDLSESVSEEILAIVSPRSRTETRFLFKN